MDLKSRIYVAGHRGLAGSAILRELRQLGFHNTVVRTREELDLRDRSAVAKFFAEEQPEYVFLAAARVGGIRANMAYPADFIRENLQIQTNVIDASYRHGVRKLLYLGSSCIYPRNAAQPIAESSLLSGPLEPTNQAYAVAKIAGLQMCSAYREQFGFDAISLMPTNLYGPNDHFEEENSHVVPALITRLDRARDEGRPEVVIWGTGKPRREFMYSADFASAAVFLMNNYSGAEPINVGVGSDISISELAHQIADVTGYPGSLRFDPSKPDGVPRKLLDISKLRALGWEASVDLGEGLRRTYEWYRASLTVT